MVAEELKSGRVLQLWRDDLLARSRPPFDVGPNALIVAYFASAELGCFLELGWPLPQNILDLYVEHRVETNGKDTLYGNGLVGALALRGLAHINAGEKDSMRRLICDQRHWSPDEQQSILEYCSSDVRGLAALLPRMASGIDWPRALLRGRYMKAVAVMERNGVPIDLAIHQQLVARWDDLKVRLITAVDADFDVFEGTTFKRERFANLLGNRSIPWPQHPNGALKLDDDTFSDQAKRWPELRPLHELRATLSGLRLTGLEVGSDCRNRCLLSPFSSITGRNQPSNVKSVFGPACWLRGLIRPAEGYGIAYIDFASQEIGIAAGLSGDERMIQGYIEGDPYLAFAKAANLAPQDATKKSHKVIRDQCKSIVLGVNYGMGPEAMAAKPASLRLRRRSSLGCIRRPISHSGNGWITSSRAQC